jgi:hypothetical protein
MDRLVIFFAMGGLINFGVGAFLSATGEINTGIVLMALGLVLQVLSLSRIKKLKKQGQGDAG